MENDTTCLINEESGSRPRLPYPKRVFFVICFEFCERFYYFGFKAILYVYMTDKLGIDAISAVIQVSIFSMAVYVMCIFGGILSDSWLGKFKTILFLSIIYALGSVIFVAGTLPYYNNEFSNTLLYIGLAMIAFGSGGIKPSVIAFGGDQFVLPEQSDYMDKFFSIFFFSVQLASITSTVLTPILKEYFQCYGEIDCYPLGFGVPAVLMIIAIVILMIGRPSYTVVPPAENVLVKVIKCTSNAIVTKHRESEHDAREHFLDYSIEKYGQQMVNDTKSLLNILVLFLPLPIFFTLDDQQSSRWIEQAKYLNLNIGFYVVQPEQMQSLSAIFKLALIPLFDYCFYPMLSKISLRRPLQKMSIGGILAAFAFLLSAILQWQIERNPPNTVSVWWQVPQILVISVSDIMFLITGITFSFEQAPKSMKSVVLACYMSTIAIGEAMLAIISDIRLFEFQSYDFILYEGLMLVDIMIFIMLARRYKTIEF